MCPLVINISGVTFTVFVGCFIFNGAWRISTNQLDLNSHFQVFCFHTGRCVRFCTQSTRKWFVNTNIRSFFFFDEWELNLRRIRFICNKPTMKVNSHTNTFTSRSWAQKKGIHVCFFNYCYDQFDTKTLNSQSIYVSQAE